MATQVSYPGVYIEEFAPASPIEGVSTSIAAFVGIAAQGPIGVPTLITSLDQFTATFGGPVRAATPYYLPLAVTGFFRNGGTVIYVLRIGTALAAHADLTARDGSGTIAQLMAKVDGPAGDGGQVVITDSSVLADALTAAGAGTTLPLAVATTTVTSLAATRRQAQVADASGFATGDQVVLMAGTDQAVVTIASTDTGVIRFTGAVPGSVDFAGGSLTTADPGPGTTRLRFVVPAAISLRALLPAGSVLKVSDGATEEWAVAAQVGADSVTLATGLTGTFDLTGPTTVASAEFDLAITDASGTTRTYAGLSTTPTHPQWWRNIDDPSVQLIPTDLIPAGDPRPTAATVPITGATADDPAQAWSQVASGMDDHLALLAPIDEISIVAAPGCTDQAAQQSLVAHCENQFDRIAILDAVRGSDLVTVRSQRAALTGALNKGFGALYYPWIQINDPSANAQVLQPPSGHIAGVYARTDQTRGVHKAPANIGITGAVGLERRLTDADQSVLNPDGVNAIRLLPGRGAPVVWGARTTASDTTWQYVNIRRLFCYLEESIQQGLATAVFEPNDLGLWQRLKRTLTEFLTRTWQDGALFGETAKDAFYVRIDEALNPPSTRKLGRLYVEIGVQPVYPAEFIVVRIGIWDGGSEVAEQ